MVAVGSIGQRADLGDDANGRLLGGDDNTVHLVQAIAHLRVQQDGRLTGSLGMKLGRKTDLEQHVLHHIAGQRLRQTQLLLGGGFKRQILVGMAERHVVKTPLWCSQHTGHTHLATQRDIGQAHTPARRITGSPGLARARIGRMAVSAQRLAIDEGMGQRREQLLAVGAHELGAHRRGRHLDQYHVVQADAVEGVLQRQHTLNLVSHDHGFEHFAHQQWAFTSCHVFL
ncbi:hypothetical protein D3C81_1133800 [compost metagenome]